jgi:ubiquinone/menaquinone biosynthesis C-methylase UbiE
MNAPSGMTITSAATAFDRIAGSYDERFTRTLIGRAQRNQVWTKLTECFVSGDRVLELNCGTGEDAIYLSHRGRSVVACDASSAMIEAAKGRNGRVAMPTNLEFLNLATEELDVLDRQEIFDGAFSNFSGLNCIGDLKPVARSLAALIKPGGKVLLCMWSRICVSEVLWHLLHGNPRKAFRRFPGKSTARLGDATISVSYPSVPSISRTFSPWFCLRSRSAVGLFVPPSYAEAWATSHKRALASLEKLDRRCREWPILRDIGDHVLLEFVRCNS